MIRYGSRFIFFYHTRHLMRVWEYKIKKKSNSFPSVIQIQSINDCNGSCSMCPNSQIHNKTIEPMTDKLFEKIISEILNESKVTPLILLYLQNEPLMDKNIFKKIQLIKNQSKGKVHVGFLTNGNLFNEEKLKELENLKKVFISFSLDAFTKGTYNKIRNSFNFENVLGNINKILNSKYDSDNVVVEFTVQKNNIFEFKDFKKFWGKKTGGLLINYLTNRSGDLSNYNDLYSPENNYSTIERFKFYIMRNIMNFCPLPFTSFYILSNGDVILCREDWTKKLILGNVNESSIKEIWNNEKYQEIRNLIYNKRYNEISLCRKCSRWRNGYFQVF